MSEQFLHLRRPQVSILSHGLGVDRYGPLGGITVVLRKLNDPETEEIIGYDVAFARCRPDERYVKRVGRETALEHLKEGQFEFFPQQPEQIIPAVVDWLANSSRHRKNLRAGVRNGGFEP